MRKEQIFGHAPFIECHASSLLPLRHGGFLAVWFGGSKEGNNDVGIWGAIRNNDWSAPLLIAKLCDEPHWNPVLFRERSGRIALFFKVGRTIKDWHTWRTFSCDEGIHWSAATELVPGDITGGRGPVKNKPIELSDGAILAPASVEREQWRAFTDRSTDGGNSWQRSAPIKMGTPGEIQAIQPTLWESAPGMVHMLLRTNAGNIFRSDSRDGGRSWGKAYPTGLPNNNSGIDLAKFPDGALALCANLSDINWGPRNRLALFVSHDNGTTWSKPFYLENEPDGEFSYPAVIALPGNELAVTYTWRRRGIVFFRATRSELHSCDESRKKSISSLSGNCDTQERGPSLLNR